MAATLDTRVPSFSQQGHMMLATPTSSSRSRAKSPRRNSQDNIVANEGPFLISLPRRRSSRTLLKNIQNTGSAAGKENEYEEQNTQNTLETKKTAPCSILKTSKNCVHKKRRNEGIQWVDLQPGWNDKDWQMYTMNFYKYDAPRHCNKISSKSSIKHFLDVDECKLMRIMLKLV